jgi:hypothetical protein
MGYRVAVFVRHSGADGLGHVGWAFDVDATAVDEGSVENPSGDPVCDPAHMGAWSQLAPDPMPAMVVKRYDQYRWSTLGAANLVKAFQTIAWLATQYYLVIGRNCMDDAYDVLTSLGCSLPVPFWDPVPNVWFDAVGWTERTIADPWPPVPAAEAAAAAALPHFPAAALGEIGPVAPAWRVQGTPEWEAFERERRATWRDPRVHAFLAQRDAARAMGPGTAAP